MKTFLSSKIHRCTVTESNVDYEGSVTIDPVLMQAACIYEYEQVHIWNTTNGSRLVTYAIKGRNGSGEICVNGAGAHLNKPGDVVIIAAFEHSDVYHNKDPIVILIESKDNKVWKIK